VSSKGRRYSEGGDVEEIPQGKSESLVMVAFVEFFC
jgi:hypothetical protein